MANILVLAFAAAIYPTLLAIVLVALRRPRPARLLAAYLAGGMIVGLACGCIIVFALKGSGVTTEDRTVSPAIDIAVGVLAIALAVTLARGLDPRPARLKRRKQEARAEGKESWTTRAVSRDSLKLAFVLGVVLDLPSLWYLIALKDIADSGSSPGVQVLMIVIFNLIMFLLVEVPLVAYVVAPERAQETVGRLNDWLHDHARPLTEGIAGTVGAYLVVKGIVAL